MAAYVFSTDPLQELALTDSVQNVINPSRIHEGLTPYPDNQAYVDAVTSLVLDPIVSDYESRDRQLVMEAYSAADLAVQSQVRTDLAV
jgi:hypothetical protein